MVVWCGSVVILGGSGGGGDERMAMVLRSGALGLILMDTVSPLGEDRSVVPRRCPESVLSVSRRRALEAAEVKSGPHMRRTYSFAASS